MKQGLQTVSVSFWWDIEQLGGSNKVNSAFHPSRVGKSSTGLLGWGESRARSPVSGGR